MDWQDPLIVIPLPNIRVQALVTDLHSRQYIREAWIVPSAKNKGKGRKARYALWVTYTKTGYTFLKNKYILHGWRFYAGN